MSKKTKFTQCRPRKWTGRYGRIPGKTPVFRARADGTMEVYWSVHGEDTWLTSEAVADPAIEELIEAINKYKLDATGSRGGSFLINEFGQVLVPSGGSRSIMLVGELQGVPEFEDPCTDDLFHLAGEDFDGPGEEWELPYVGMRFNLMSDDRIRFKHQTADGENNVYLASDADALVEALRKVRPSGTIRFVVNLHGVVLTKTEPDWAPVFVCRLDYDEWFDKE